ncbi:MAG: acyl-CoA ligase (AMP-forming), exosortase A system-associated [Elusimicrobia bacterium]|nr:acyl-CoA ligase (AMP-forming), exosortase A system-associated [Elusimicrobiota bacterium]
MDRGILLSGGRSLKSSFLIHHLIGLSAFKKPTNPALTAEGKSMTYNDMGRRVAAFARGSIKLGLGRQERVGIYLEKRPETVISFFGAAAAGLTFVPINPLLKPDQVGHILRDCSVRMLITSAERQALLSNALQGCPDLRHTVLVGEPSPLFPAALTWAGLMEGSSVGEADLFDETLLGHRVIDTDMAAIFYTSGSTGKPKGVVLSHRNMVAGAKSVAAYLGNHSGDTLLAALPLSFDAGFSQLTTGFHSGARVVLLNYLLPRDVLNAVVSPQGHWADGGSSLWIQLSSLPWPSSVTEHLRYFANTGGRMPLETLKTLRAHFPRTTPFLMYGLTEAFRSTFLPPEEVDRRPDSIGRAIPNAEIWVLREDGTPCGPNEPGELVHRGALVAMGYWNDPEKTAERFRPLPPGAGREAGLPLSEIAVFSGDTVRRDEEGFLYFVGRRDEMIKTSGYRVSPTEIEEVLYDTQAVGEAAVFGVAHPTLGQAAVAVVKRRPESSMSEAGMMDFCRERLPAFMVPAQIHFRDASLPRNPNGKIDRKSLSLEFSDLFQKPGP